MGNIMSGEETQVVTSSRKMFRDLLQDHTDEIQAALPRVGITPERLVRVALTECQRDPKLLECDPGSMIRAILTAAQLGLMPDGALSIVYLIPYKHEVSFQLGRDGLRTLVERSGAVNHVQCHSVYKGEDFDYLEGSSPRIEHQPDPWAEKQRIQVPYKSSARDFEPAEQIGNGMPFLGVYALAWMKGHDYPVCEVLSFADIERLRKASKVPASPAWRNWYERMSETKGLRQLCIHRLPKSTEDPELRKARIAAEFDALADAGKPQPKIDLDPEVAEALERMEGTGGTPRRMTDKDREIITDAQAKIDKAKADRSGESMFPDPPDDDDDGADPKEVCPECGTVQPISTMVPGKEPEGGGFPPMLCTDCVKEAK